MPRKPNTIHYIYKTTNLINKKFYIGMHSTSNINDGYLGSGLILRRSIRKYGEKNFKREILEYCDSREMLAKREEAIVTQKLINNKLCMNLMLGGEGGNGYTNITKEEHLRFSKLGGIKAQERKRVDPEYAKRLKESNSKSLKQRHATKQINYITWPKGKKHKEETKLKMSQSSKGVGKGNSNSQFNTMWITNGKQNKKIKKDDVIPNGYYKGRLK